jgi:hypothetical protein
MWVVIAVVAVMILWNPWAAAVAVQVGFVAALKMQHSQ